MRLISIKADVSVGENIRPYKLQDCHRLVKVSFPHCGLTQPIQKLFSFIKPNPHGLSLGLQFVKYTLHSSPTHFPIINVALNLF